MSIKHLRIVLVFTAPLFLCAARLRIICSSVTAKMRIACSPKTAESRGGAGSEGVNDVFFLVAFCALTVEAQKPIYCV